MPQITFQAGAKLFVPDTADIRQAAQEAIEDDRQRQRSRAFKWLRLPEYLRGSASGGVLTLGVASGQSAVGPAQGYAWGVKSLVVTGLTAAASPDTVNFFLNDKFSGAIWWQLNGNSFGQTFGSGQRILMAGDTLSVKSTGTFNATGTVIVSGEVWEVPAERISELY